MMTIRTSIEAAYRYQVQQFVESTHFQKLTSGQLSPNETDQFIANLCKSHLKSPQILAFLYAIAPPAGVDAIQHNMLEELGLDAEGLCHPDVLWQLAIAAGFEPEQLQAIEVAAQEQVRSLCTDPLMFATIRELGLSVLLEVTCFEWMLSRLSSRLGQALQSYRGLSTEALRWFYHHSEVDIRHAEEGLDSVVAYVQYYEIEDEELETLLDITFRENVFGRRYCQPTPWLPTRRAMEVAS